MSEHCRKLSIVRNAHSEASGREQGGVDSRGAREDIDENRAAVVTAAVHDPMTDDGDVRTAEVSTASSAAVRAAR